MADLNIYVVNGISHEVSSNTYGAFAGIFTCKNQEEAIGEEMIALQKKGLGVASIYATLVTQTCRDALALIDKDKAGIDESR